MTVITLTDGNVIPQVGFGVAFFSQQETEASVLRAIEAGYRLIDTAVLYNNEAEVGDAIAATDVARDDLFITTKVWPNMFGYDNAIKSFHDSMARMKLDHLDLLLLHWPAPELDLYTDSWCALIALQERGRVGSIGVSNFSPDQLTRLADETGVMPVINQIELHPYFQRREEVAFHRKHNIVTECWSPLGRGECLSSSVIGAIAAKHSCSTAQVMLRWMVEEGFVAIPRSKSPVRVRENIDLGFTLDTDDRTKICGLDRGVDGRISPDPTFPEYSDYSL